MRRIPIQPVADDAPDPCSGAEAFALRVLGDSMAPEFVEGDIVVIEPAGLATDGSYVLAQVDGEWIFRRLARTSGGWELRAENPVYPATTLASLEAVRGVIIQKSKPGRRKATQRYVE